MASALAYWAYAPRDLRRIIDLEFVTGGNRPVIHTSVHSPMDDKEPGLSVMIFGQHFNRHETWAELARPSMDYMARSALLLQRGRYVADVAYCYGEEAPLTGLYGETPVGDAPPSSAYDLVHSDALMNVLTNDGPDLIAPSGARYRALFRGGSSDRMTLGTLQRVAALAQGGATIVGKAPELWHADTGTSEPICYRMEGDVTAVPIDLAAEESVFVVFRKPTTTPALNIPQPVLTSTGLLDGGWSVQFQPGRNSLTVRVANLWVNRLIGDAQPGAAPVTWTAIPTYMKDAPLRRSGLIGPVVLLEPGSR